MALGLTNLFIRPAVLFLMPPRVDVLRGAGDPWLRKFRAMFVIGWKLLTIMGIDSSNTSFIF